MASFTITISIAGYNSMLKPNEFDLFLSAIERDLEDPSRSALTALKALTKQLEAIRQQAPLEWKEYCDQLRKHPIHQTLLQDPYTYRAFYKPRGFAGDAVMLDYVYEIGAGNGNDDLSRIGQQVLAYTAGLALPACAVRERRSRAAAFLERSVHRDQLKVLSFAAGHLRELDSVSSLVASAGLKVQAMDADPEAILIMTEVGKSNVEPRLFSA